jgi:hypothetical protein
MYLVDTNVISESRKGAATNPGVVYDGRQFDKSICLEGAQQFTCVWHRMISPSFFGR